MWINILNFYLCLLYPSRLVLLTSSLYVPVIRLAVGGSSLMPNFPLGFVVILLFFVCWIFIFVHFFLLLAHHYLSIIGFGYFADFRACYIRILFYVCFVCLQGSLEDGNRFITDSFYIIWMVL